MLARLQRHKQLHGEINRHHRFWHGHPLGIIVFGVLIIFGITIIFVIIIVILLLLLLIVIITITKYMPYDGLIDDDKLTSSSTACGIIDASLFLLLIIIIIIVSLDLISYHHHYIPNEYTDIALTLCLCDILHDSDDITMPRRVSARGHVHRVWSMRVSPGFPRPVLRNRYTCTQAEYIPC